MRLVTKSLHRDDAEIRRLKSRLCQGVDMKFASFINLPGEKVH